MKPTEKHPEGAAAQVSSPADMPVVKPKPAGKGSGRSTLEDRVGIAVRPTKVTRSSARSTFRDLHTV